MPRDYFVLPKGLFSSWPKQFYERNTPMVAATITMRMEPSRTARRFMGMRCIAALYTVTYEG